MKRALLLIALLVPLLGYSQSNVLYGTVSDYGIAPQSGIKCTLTLVSPNPRVVDGVFVRRDPIERTTSTNGYFSFTNIIWGKYTFQIAGKTTTEFGIYVQTNSTGSIPLGSLATTVTPPGPNPATNYYTMSQIDSLLAGIEAGTNAGMYVFNSNGLATNLFVYGGINMDSNQAAPSWGEGKLFYDTTQHTLAFYNDNTNVMVNVGSEQLIRVRNRTGSTIPDGSAVYINGAQGQVPTIALAIATNTLMGQAVGLVTADIEDQGYGYVTVQGLVNGLNTSAYADGATLYLSTNVPGGWMTNTASGAIQIGYVAYSHNNQGKLLVNIVPNAVGQTQWPYMAITNAPWITNGQSGVSLADLLFGAPNGGVNTYISSGGITLNNDGGDNAISLQWENGITTTLPISGGTFTGDGSGLTNVTADTAGTATTAGTADFANAPNTSDQPPTRYAGIDDDSLFTWTRDGSQWTNIPFAAASTYATNLASTTWGGISNSAAGATNLIVKNNSFIVAEGSTNTLVVTNGVVGIGNASPNVQLDVRAPASAASVTALRLSTDRARGTTGDSQNIDFLWYNTFYNARISGFVENASGNGTGGLRFYTTTNGFQLNAAPSMSMAADGKIGVGTVSPTARLSVAGDVTALSATITNTLSTSNLIVGTTYPTLLTSDSTGLVTDQPLTVGGVTPTVNVGTLGQKIAASGTNALRYTVGDASVTMTNPATGVGQISGSGAFKVRAEGGQLTLEASTGVIGVVGQMQVEGQFRAASSTASTFKSGLGSLNATITNTLTASNIVTSVPKWVDCASHIYWQTGAGAGNSVTNSITVGDVGDGTFGMLMLQTNGTERLPFVAEAPHTLCDTNSSITAASLYTEAHMHVRSLTNCPANQTNAYFVIIWKGCLSKWSTNSVTQTNLVSVNLGSSSLDALVESGPLWYTNFHPSIASTFPGTWIRTNGPGAYLGPVVVKVPSVHVPVGFPNAIGSTTDTAQ